MKNICAIIASLFLFFSICPVSHSYEKQDIFSLIPQEKDRLLKYKLDSNFDEIYNRINDIYSMIADITNTQSYDRVPVGCIILFSTTTAPSNFLYCNGAAVSRTTYVNLFNVIGTRYGSGDGSTTFNVPDMRGLFARGVDDGRGIDKETGRIIGSTETFSMQGHFHRITGRTAANTTNAYPIISAWDTGTAANNNDIAVNTVLSDPAYGTVNVSSETRPSNMAWAYMIKYR